jgi:hypothetical protein
LLAGRRIRPAPWRLGEEAATTLEFTLVFPIFLMIILTIWQLLLLVNATQIMSYAAFSATRSAIVVVPLELPGEEANMVATPESSEKVKMIRRAAALACTPISPPIGEWFKSAGVLGIPSLSIGFSDAGDLATLLVLLDQANLNGSRALQKALYAQQFTDIEIDGKGRGNVFAPDSPLTVTVRHKFFLNVPYANRLFRDDALAWFGVGAPQRTLTARYTLTNEGEHEAP